MAVVAVARAWHEIAPRVRERLAGEVTVTIPEGLTAIEMDRLLAEEGITPAGAVRSIAERDELEGYLFPDTYRFRKHSDPEVVVRRLKATFEQKARPLLSEDPAIARETVIVASLLEKEVPDPADRRIVAGIVAKRREARMPLQLDATICYFKQLASSTRACYPITAVDLTYASPYNTYLYRGLPPGPIGNPGVGALTAALDPQASPYWFYLSDPATGRTVFSETNEQHEAAKERYLR